MTEVDRTRSVLSSPWGIASLLLAITFLGDGLLIPWLGFYWDDWPMMWFLRSLGPAGFRDVWAMDRPMLGWWFQLTTTLLGAQPWGWHLFALLARWLSSLTLWWALSQLWPNHRRRVMLSALLFAVYPGFQQISIAVIYSHYFLVLSLVNISLGTMVVAVRRSEQRWWALPLSLLSGALSLFTLEFFLGMELARPLILWLVLRRDERSPARVFRRVLRFWSPYLLVLSVYLPWRVLLVGFRAYKPTLLQGLVGDATQTATVLVSTALGDLWQAGVQAWLQAIRPPLVSEFGRLSTLIYWGVVGLGGLLALALLKGSTHVKQRGEQEGEGRSSWGMEALGLGAFALLAGGWPHWIPQLPLELYFPFDRFTLGLMFGSSLLVAGVLDLLLRARWPWLLVAAALVGLSVGSHFEAATAFRRAWNDQRAFFWQLAWRIPGLEPGTTVITNESPLPYLSDNSITGAFNWMYAPGARSRELPYMVYDIDTRLGRGLKSTEPGIPIIQPYRAATFRGSTSQVLVLFLAPPRCLHVVDPILSDSSPLLGPPMSQVVALSRPELIRVNEEHGARPPETIFGPEPSRDSWCYYFQKADLARQQGDWERVVALGEKAFALRDKPNDASERIPFIEGYAHMGRWARALEITQEAFEHDSAVGRMLCRAWDRIERDLASEAAREAASQARLDLGCSGG